MTAQSQGSNGLQGLIGQRVRVESIAGDGRFVDDGKIEAYEHPWVVLRKENDEVLYLTVYNIRYIKAA